MDRLINFLLRQPFLYKLIQATVAYNGHKVIKSLLQKEIPKNTKTVLDQGCGTGEYSLLFKGKYTGIDNYGKNIEHAKKTYKEKFVLGDATDMPFRDCAFDVVFAVGLHHHLDDVDAKEAINEAMRVLKRSGKLIIIDALLPSFLLNPLGYILRKVDMGRFVRMESHTLDLLPRGMNMEKKILHGFPLDYIVLIIRKELL